MKRMWIIVALAGCAGGAGFETNVDGNNSGADSAGECIATINFDPYPVYAGDHVRATAMVSNANGVIDYSWKLDGAPITTYEAPDHSAIGIDVPTATSHQVEVDILGVECTPGISTLIVNNAQGAVVDYRLRVIAPSNLAPPQDIVVQVHGGMNLSHMLPLDPGTEVIGFVKNGTTGIPAYLEFTPLVGPPVEAFSGPDGSFDVRLALQAHTVLIVPSVAGLAPRLTTWMSGVTTFAIDPGTSVTGVVRDPSNAALAGAKVQLSIGGVPSTVATTAGDGSFTLQAVPMQGAQVTVSVTPPATSGLPRLAATAQYDLSQSLQISYAGSPSTCDLAATPVKRAGANQAGAQITIVGAIAGTVGTIATGAVSQPASATVLVAATANGSGLLPATLVPRAPLSAVVQLAASDFAVASIDTSACAAQTITAPPMIPATGITTDTHATALAGVRVEATPTGVLAMANLVPVEATSTTGGAFALQLASGGQYNVRFFDPAGRVAPLVVSNVAAAGVPASAGLPAALAITGPVMLSNDPNPIVNASVQVLCGSCTGIDATVPLAATATDNTSHYAIAVPDPGTM